MADVMIESLVWKIKSEAEKVPQIKGAFGLVFGSHPSFGWKLRKVRQQELIVEEWGVIVGQSHIVGCRYGWLSDGEQNIV